MPLPRNYQGYSNKSQVRFIGIMGSFLIFLVALILSVFTNNLQVTYADDPCKNIADQNAQIECYNKELAELNKDQASKNKKLSDVRSKIDSVSSKIAGLAGQLSVKQSELNAIDSDIKEVENELNEIDKKLEERHISIDKRSELRDKVLRNHYQSGMLNDLELFISLFPQDKGLNGFQFATLSFMFDKALTNDSIRLIEILNKEIKSFEADRDESAKLKAELETAMKNLVAAKLALDAQKKVAQDDLTKLADQEEDIEEDLKDIQAEISKFSEKQQAILAQKSGEGVVSGYDAPEYKLPNPPFTPAFAAMSYGAYTHNNGMSQYGAKGRAQAGHDYKKILKHYYSVDVKTQGGFPSKISVSGYGDIDFQKYLYGIAEMPSDWPSDALKSQAIAARTYAYNYAKAGKTICTTESCQVFLKSKSDNPPSAWKKAVDDTKAMILDNPKTSQYSSTTGGYLNQSGWDTAGKWPQDAYEKKAGSPWFYKAWYTQTYRDNSSTCGRSSPWLNKEEMADVINAWKVWRKGSGSEKGHISPTTTSCWGGDPYSLSEMREVASKYGDSYKSVSNVSVDISTNGYTSKVTFQTDKGSISISGEELKTVFNLRAPGYVSLRNRLFDFEVRN
ncbi:hypothetical protein HYV31_02880 [candidate division WWE3 bacterium]|nr:hypothetical protein [candidate division WWE3 bacterium]